MAGNSCLGIQLPQKTDDFTCTKPYFYGLRWKGSGYIFAENETMRREVVVKMALNIIDSYRICNLGRMIDYVLAGSIDETKAGFRNYMIRNQYVKAVNPKKDLYRLTYRGKSMLKILQRQNSYPVVTW
ncbi:MAG TPA: hypothetical protein VFM18_03540 [Methanosarcina sp.]|nr:hypothetical protein [Methanosarcina sp.]